MGITPNAGGANESRILTRTGMNDFANINPPIVEGLYEEALALADRVRAAFDLSGRLDELAGDGDLAKVALSCEALRCTTRMMHVLAWLLNQRAFFKGELSEFQLRRYGRLPTMNPSDEADRQHLPRDLVELGRETERFYARIGRLDRSWRDHFAMQPPAIERLRARLEHSLRAV